MKRFQPYVRELELLADEAVADARGHDCTAAVDAALDGQPDRALRRLVSVGQIRRCGAFFTGIRLSDAALGPLLRSLSANSRIDDPALGVGDLLLSCAAVLPVKATLTATLKTWRQCFSGRDIHNEFVRAACLRLTLTAWRRTTVPKSMGKIDLDWAFPGLQTGCGLEDSDAIERATHLVMNPPFSMVDSRPGREWGSGKVNAAAVFVDQCLDAARDGTRLVAILPEVLRGGSRAPAVAAAGRIKNALESDGIDGPGFREMPTLMFSCSTLSYPDTIPPKAWDWGQMTGETELQVGDFFEVLVGPVVDYRDPHHGPWRLFIVSHAVPRWQVLDDIPTRRRFAGRVLQPPFVVVRRTSRSRRRASRRGHDRCLRSSRGGRESSSRLSTSRWLWDSLPNAARCVTASRDNKLARPPHLLPPSDCLSRVGLDSVVGVNYDPARCRRDLILLICDSRPAF